MPWDRAQRVSAAFWRVRRFCRGVGADDARTELAETLREELGSLDRGIARLERAKTAVPRAPGLLLAAYRSYPEGAVTTTRGPKTITDLVYQTAGLAKDCEWPGAADALDAYIARIESR